MDNEKPCTYVQGFSAFVYIDNVSRYLNYNKGKRYAIFTLFNLKKPSL